MNESAIPGPDTVPAWVQGMSVAVWVSDVEGTVLYMNEKAEALLDKEPGVALGQPCHLMVAGQAEDGSTWCEHNCQVKQAARDSGEIDPYTMRIHDEEGEEHWLQMLVIPYRSDEGGLHLAHCAFRIDRSHIIQSYLDRVAARTPINVDRDFNLEDSRLSRREREVLQLLAEDQNLYEIAEKLGVSYYTVRNHVQHILGKMGVHSTLEAVALYLLSQSQDSEL